MRKWDNEYRQREEVKEKKRIRDFAYYNLRNKVMTRDKFKCTICGCKERLTIHHKDYDSNSMNKLITVCKDCHYKIHAKIRRD